MFSFADLPETELLSLLRSGNRNAFDEIYRRYWKQIFSIAANKTRQLEEAEEIVQDIFISLWDRREVVEIGSTLGAYLAVSVKYRVIKRLAKQNQYNRFADYSAHFMPQTGNSTQEWLEFQELKSRLELLVSRLPEKCRLVYQLSREQGFSQKQIAEQYGISEKTVEAHIGKALKVLRTGLSQLLL